VSVNYGDVPEWLGSVVTGGALIAALYQIRGERTARKRLEQSSAAAARIEQARKISAWFTGFQDKDGSLFRFANRSEEPIYEVVVWFVFVESGGAGPRRGEDWGDRKYEYSRVYVSVPPGLYQVSMPSGWGGMNRHPAAEIGFTDAAGVYWIRRSDGSLEDVDQSMLDHYGLGRPIGFRALEPVRE
jgi:hypothetical protein